MENISWIAGNGQEVKVIHVTEESNIADHTITNKIDDLKITLGGSEKIYQGMVDGMIAVMGGKIRIPEEKKEAVMSIINGVADRRAARRAASEKIEKEYTDNHNKVKKAMEE